ncbi:MAG TPA: hypothetical protein VKR61_13550 [Bryobacteraceae bacterium]|nr:hypothetical protein [Bryobacteraceae bacterium]
MFTWICPTCGREVPPAYDACPDCAARAKSGDAAATAAVQAPPGSAPAAYAPPPAAPPVMAASVPQYAVPPPHGGLPTWLLTILFAFAFVGLGGGVYALVQYFRGGSQAAASGPSAPIPSRASGVPNSLQKYVEVSGLRFVADPKNEKAIEARFLVINHSGADIAGLAGTVNIWGRTAKSEEEAAGTFSFKMPSLGPYESKEATAPVTTKLKAYELPDWQNLSTEVQITSP